MPCLHTMTSARHLPLIRAHKPERKRQQRLPNNDSPPLFIHVYEEHMCLLHPSPSRHPLRLWHSLRSLSPPLDTRFAPSCLLLPLLPPVASLVQETGT